jgi:hypothetical protein
LLDWLVHIKTIQDLQTEAKVIVGVLALTTGVGELITATSWVVRGVAALETTIAASDLILMNTSVRNAVKGCFATPQEGEDFLKSYENITLILNGAAATHGLVRLFRTDIHQFHAKYTARKTTIDASPTVSADAKAALKKLDDAVVAGKVGDVVEGVIDWITQRKAFWDDWINKCFPGKNWGNTTFQTLGQDYNTFKAANTALDNEMRAMYNSAGDADNFLPGIVNSGSTYPIKITANQGEKFYKIVPKGSNINSPSPYYLNEAEYQWIKANPSQLEQKLGLPLSSVNAEYDVFTITSKANSNTLFQSTVAPTKQFANATPNIVYSTTGGRTQSLIINNGKTNLWEKSTTPIETISPSSLPVIGN